MSKLFTSDLHFGHHKIIDYCNRPFIDVDQMNDIFIHNWNKVVKANDIIYILGDVFFCKEEKAISIIKSLKGQKRLVLGNHDKVIRRSSVLLSCFDAVLPDLYQENIDGIPVTMCHYPLMSWEKSFYGSFMLHGHMHSPKPTDSTYRRYDVGVDANDFSPVSWEAIKNTLNNIESANEPLRLSY